MGTHDPVFRDENNPPPGVPDELPADGLPPAGAGSSLADGTPLDEEQPQHVPGSFLEALPQFFVFPLILVATLTVIYIGLRWLGGSESKDARQLVEDLRLAGPHTQWQVAQQLADGLRRERIDLEAVPASELGDLYERASTAEAASEREAQANLQMQQYLLQVMAFKEDPALTRFAVEALDSDLAAMRESALASLMRMADPGAVPALLEHLRSPVREERWLAIGALAETGTPEALDGVAALLDGHDTLDHRNAVLALAARGDERAADYLPPMLRRDSYATDSALDVTELAGDDASLAIVRTNLVDQFLLSAVRAAVALGDPTVVPQLQQLRENDPSLKVQSAAINALYDMGVSEE